MLYIVSGYMRTGTSMMMKALEAGGLEASFNKDRNKMNQKFGDNKYQPNVEGFYELSPSDYVNPDLPKIHDGKLIKLLITDQRARASIEKSGVPHRVVFMKRNPEEIRQSFEAFWGNARQVMSIVENYDRMMKIAVARWGAFAESVSVFQFRQVITTPDSAFKVLAHQGWPIDSNLASREVNPDKLRFKLENLEVGI